MLEKEATLICPTKRGKKELEGKVTQNIRTLNDIIAIVPILPINSSHVLLLNIQFHHQEDSQHILRTKIKKKRKGKSPQNYEVFDKEMQEGY